MSWLAGPASGRPQKARVEFAGIAVDARFWDCQIWAPMRSRWYHRPVFHSPALGIEKRASWLELFYDLIFVAAFIQLGNGLSAHVSLSGALSFCGVFVPLWVSWTGFTFYQNRYSIDDFVHRISVFVQMFAVGGMALGAGTVLSGDSFGFSISAGIALLTVGLLFFRAVRQVSEGRAYSTYWGAVFVLSGFIWLASAFVTPPLSHALWGGGTLLVLGAPFNRRSVALAERFPIDLEHLAERYALLTLIVLGESFVKVLSALSVESAGLDQYLETGVVLLITCGVWWIYFDDIAHSEIKHGKTRWLVWLYSHLPLQMSITAVGVSLKKAVQFTFIEPAPDKYRWLLAGFLSLVFFSVAALDSVTERKNAQLGDRSRVTMRWVSGLVILLLAPAGNALSGGTFLILITSVVVSQVVFDMMLAPLEEDAHAEHSKQSVSAASRRRREQGESVRLRRDAGATVRKGAPSELRSDLYFFFMDGGWPRVFVAFGFLFAIANVLFATLYLLEPGSLNNGAEASFADAFFFSVQTMSTIGYGVLSPANHYANLIVTAEAACSMIGLAIVTGFVFAKVSRPKASALFSNNLLVTKIHGMPTLTLRVGNARGNDVVEASMNLVVLKEEFSPEGAHMRRLHDLKLVRNRSPMFTMTWSVMHVIDESSPLYGTNWDDSEKEIVSFVATLMGHDGTYGQTTYARHVYQAADVRVGHRFADVIDELEDGRMMIDYGRFHHTEPEP